MNNVTEWLQTVGVWLSRIAYCRGFGIQSPSAYRFVRYVINEHYPYYAYADLQKRVPVESRVALRLLRLCLRVANEVQPRYILDFIDGLSAERQEYFSAGARRARILSVAEDDEVPAVVDGERVVIRTGVQHVDALLSLLPRIDSASVVMVDGIHRDARSRETWQRIVGNSHAAVCYDLYYTGIVMLDQSQHKHCYTINF